MKKQISIHTEGTYFKYIEIPEKTLSIIWKYIIAGPSVLVFGNQNMVPLQRYLQQVFRIWHKQFPANESATKDNKMHFWVVLFHFAKLLGFACLCLPSLIKVYKQVKI